MMASNLKDIINIGKDTEKKLVQVGIDTYEKLESIGSEQAFLRLQALDPGTCINLLYGLQGAIDGTKWNELPKEKKTELLHFYNMATGKKTK